MFVYGNLFALVISIIIALTESRPENECTRKYDSVTTISQLDICCKEYFECKCIESLCKKTGSSDSAECAQFHDDCYDLTIPSPTGHCLPITWNNFQDKCTKMDHNSGSTFDSNGKSDSKVEQSAGTSTVVIIVVIVIIVLLALIGVGIFWVYHGRGKKVGGSSNTRSKNKHHKAIQGESNKTVASTPHQLPKQQVGGGSVERHGQSAIKATQHSTSHQIAPKVSLHEKESLQDKSSFDSRAVNTRFLPKADKANKNSRPSHATTNIRNMLA